MLLALKIAAPFLLLSMLSEPALNVLLGLAVCAEKSAPEPTATATAASPSARAPSVRRGRRLSGAGIVPAGHSMLTAIACLPWSSDSVRRAR